LRSKFWAFSDLPSQTLFVGAGRRQMTLLWQ
jgi:hypothetical protein